MHFQLGPNELLMWEHAKQATVAAITASGGEVWEVGDRARIRPAGACTRPAPCRMGDDPQHFVTNRFGQTARRREPVRLRRQRLPRLHRQDHDPVGAGLLAAHGRARGGEPQGVAGAGDTRVLPKEHGAYGQMAFPILTALAIGGLSVPAILTAVAAIAAFLGHEAVAVLAGRRGPRARREAGGLAAFWLVVAATVTATSGLAAIALSAAVARWSFVIPMSGAVLVAWLFAIHQEKSAAGEMAVALTFSSVALPMCVSAGTPWPAGVTVTIAFATLFVGATLAVRVVVLGTRAGGNPRAVHATRVGLGLVMSRVERGVRDAPALVGPVDGARAATAPGVLAALAIASRPPAPTELRRLGWTLLIASAVTASMLVFALRPA